MKVRLTSITVDNQEKALAFYTSQLGFVKKTEIPMGEHKWLTVVAADEQDGVEVVLEPLGFAPAKTYQQALFAAGIPATAFYTNNLDEEYERLQNSGVVFSMPPTVMGAVKLAVFDDTCGNHIQLYQTL
jgi:predicted enzyme related to lactoylglutathione lyase